MFMEVYALAKTINMLEEWNPDYSAFFIRHSVLSDVPIANLLKKLT